MDGSSTFALLKALAPKLPSIAGATASHSLGLSETSAKWDLRTTVIMATLRSFLVNPKPSPVGKMQKLSMRDPGVKGPMWISKQTIPATSGDSGEVLKGVCAAVDALADDKGSKRYAVPEFCPVEVEWTGSRPGVGKNEPRPKLDEGEQYTRLMNDTTSDVTVLYLHGGALFLMDPATHRVTVTRLAKHTGGRCLSVRYRLAPQHPFPSALLDCLLAYLYLLSPPPGAVHEPVPADKIVFAGDSAGGNLSLALLQLLLELHRQNGDSVPTLRFHGKDVAVPVPAGLALQSPWTDLTKCLPSTTLNQAWDYLVLTDADFKYVQDADWPANPARADLYCEASMLRHPLVSPMCARNWTSAPPVFICIGEESLADEGMVTARRIAACHVKTEFWQFEAMPHVFPAVLTELEGGKLAMKLWADAITGMVAGQTAASRGCWVEAKTLKEKPLDVLSLAPQLSDTDILSKMTDAQAKKKVVKRSDAGPDVASKL